jgi:hypothetical protein
MDREQVLDQAIGFMAVAEDIEVTARNKAAYALATCNYVDARQFTELATMADQFIADVQVRITF